jgi:FkbM family methyltransferase
MMHLQDSAHFLAGKEQLHELICGRKVFVLGRNRFATVVAEQLNCAGFIDDTFAEPVWLGKPVLRIKDLAHDSVVVSCVVAARPLTAMERCQAHGVAQFVDYFALSRFFPDQFPAVDYCEENREDILCNRESYEAVYESLADDISRRTFEKVVNFRFTMDLENMRGFQLATHRQYIEDFLVRDKAGIFVDGGGFDGQTTRQFVDWNPDFRKVLYFEPIAAQMEDSKRRLSDVRDILYFQNALHRESCTLRFTTNGSSSTISAEGETVVEAVDLDSVTDDKVGLIKLDIEGGELDAIAGAARIISEDHPALAVCIYHRPSDFYKIPGAVLSLYPGYRVFVRHYTEGVNETVMFFVP